MGCSSSKGEKCEALRLCGERKRLVKEAIDSRYALTAAHLAYLQSLRSIGVSLTRFAEAEVSSEAAEVDKTPSHSSYPSPSPSHNALLVDSPLPSYSSNVSYMKSSGTASVTVKLEPSLSGFGEEEAFNFPPPPPPPPEIDSSWDFFDPSDATKMLGENGLRRYNSEVAVGLGEFGLDYNAAPTRNRDPVIRKAHSCENFEDAEQMPFEDDNSALTLALAGNAALEQSSSTRASAEREDPSEFITHRAKDFLSSIKDIENRFFRASESGKEVSRMLEANKIRLRCSEGKGKSSSTAFLEAFHLACCRGDNVIPDDPPQPMTKAITWHRAVSSQSSSSKNPLTYASKEDVDDSGSDFIEEFSMITGSHSSTLDRLYAWEQKLYDEVKTSEFIRKSYEHWCAELRHLFARDASVQVIDKTRAIVKDLHSQLRIALHAVDSIAKRIERLRDEELEPQLVELIQGLIRMWKVMLECHHVQYITISLAYYTKNSTTETAHKESQRQVTTNLQHEIECFGSSFRDWIGAHRSYVEALHGWLQTSIVLPQERSRGRKVFSPRRALAPPIFVLCRDWSSGIKTLPSGELIDAIKGFISDLQASIAQQIEEQKSKGPIDSVNNEDADAGSREEQSDKSSNLSNIHTSLTKVLDRLTKFAEALLKMYENIRQGTETARVAYENCRTNRL